MNKRKMLVIFIIELIIAGVIIFFLTNTLQAKPKDCRDYLSDCLNWCAANAHGAQYDACVDECTENFVHCEGW